MICLHGYDHPNRCRQCPKRPQQTRASLDIALTGLLDGDGQRAVADLLDLHDRAMQESYAEELERLHEAIRKLRVQLDLAHEYDGRAIMAKLKSIEEQLSELSNSG